MVRGKGKGFRYKKRPNQMRKKITCEEYLYLKGALDVLALDSERKI